VLSPVGHGRALYVRSEVTGNEPRLYTDNVDVARYIQSEIYTNNTVPFGFFADTAIAAVTAQFERSGDVRSSLTERVKSPTDDISLTWYDLLPSFKGASAADPAGGAKHGHYALYVPARGARLVINGVQAAGAPRARQRDGRNTTSAGLALAETWVKPIAAA
jgi:hypothetical protein